MGPVPFSVKAYEGVSRLLYPAVPPLLSRRQRRGKEDQARLGERRGVAGLPRPEGVLVWLHGASVGELVSLLPLAEHLTGRGLPVLVTSGTVTSAEVARRRLPLGAFHQYVPIDLPAYVERFLAHWRPDIAVFAESELWPNLVHAAQAGGARLVLANARMSERSFRRWSRFPGFIGSMLTRFELALAQSEADAERLRRLGAPRVEAIGNLKYDVAPPPADPEKLVALEAAVQGRPIFVAASTHPGEEEQVAEAHALASGAIPDLLTILIPRHPERGAEVAALVSARGLSVLRRSEGVLPDAKTQVYVADTIGELGLFYRLSPLAYCGGSLVEHGGQNPIEPAKLGAAVLHGPHVRNFAEVYAALDQGGGAAEVADAKALGTAVARLLGDRQTLGRMAAAAEAAVAAMSGAMQRTIDALDPLLIQARPERRDGARA
jgi:3-deoxy-D-manno-octulosonic-acid transferase